MYIWKTKEQINFRSDKEKLPMKMKTGQYGF